MKNSRLSPVSFRGAVYRDAHPEPKKPTSRGPENEINMSDLVQYKKLVADHDKLTGALDRVKAEKQSICKALFEANGKGFAYDFDGVAFLITTSKSGTHFFTPKDKGNQGPRGPRKPKEEKAPKAPKLPKATKASFEQALAKAANAVAVVAPVAPAVAVPVVAVPVVPRVIEATATLTGKGQADVVPVPAAEEDELMAALAEASRQS